MLTLELFLMLLVFFYVPFCKKGSDVVIEIITINNDTKYVTSDRYKCKYLNRFNIFIK